MEELNLIQKIAVMALPLIIAIVLHEVAHGWVADRLGDHTARDMGRLTLNPISHIDLFGTIVMPLVLFALTAGTMIFGYAKPVPINPSYFKNPKKGMALIAMAGPGTNILVAVVCSILLRGGLANLEGKVPEPAWSYLAFPLTLMLGYGIMINLVLAVLNMIPIPPLDGSRVMYWLLPPRTAVAYYRLQPHIMKGFSYLFLIHILLTIINATNFSPLLYVFKLLGLIMDPIIRPLLSLLVGGDIL